MRIKMKVCRFGQNKGDILQNVVIDNNKMNFSDNNNIDMGR